MEHQRLRYLLNQYLQGNLQDAERVELHRAVYAADTNAMVAVIAEVIERGAADPMEATNQEMDQVLQTVLGIDRVEQRVTMRNIWWRTWMRYAAAVILLIGIGAYLWTTTQQEKIPAPSTEALTKIDKNNISPGEDKAILTLSDGRKVELSAHTTSIDEAGTNIVNSNGKLQYGKSDKVVFNTMTTPRGGQYQLTLPDGTNVWLNSASSITYPTAFLSNTREVTITGEAYFEVVTNKEKPFKVSFNNQQVEVLGTSFNINTYPEESASRTTLVEGLIRIRKDSRQLILQPNEQAITGNQLIINKRVDMQQVLAWKNGTFNFNGLDFATCMRQLERWYDIKVIYDGEVPKGTFLGEVDRNLNLSDAIELLNGVVARFKLQGRKLHVLK